MNKIAHSGGHRLGDAAIRNGSIETAAVVSDSSFGTSHGAEIVGDATKSRLSTSITIISDSLVAPDCLIDKCIKLLRSRLNPAEVDSEEIVGSLLARNSNPKKATCLIAALTDDAEEVLAVASGSVTPEGHLLLGYTVTAESGEGYGFGTKIYQALVDRAETTCRDEFGMPLKWLALEATDGAEVFWQRKGFKRVFLSRTGADNSYQLKYLQPPIEWDRQSGAPLNIDHFPDSRALPADIEIMGKNVPLRECRGKFEELMIKPAVVDAGEISANEVLRIIRSLYREFYFRKHRVLKEAYPNYFGYFASLIKGYHAELTGAAEIRLDP